MKCVALSNGQTAQVDDEDFDRVSGYKWYAVKYGNYWYAIAKISGKNVLMHRLLMDPPSDKVIDHINHDGLDNRKINLRVCTISENRRNSKTPATNTTGHRGVTFDKGRKSPWHARIFVNGKNLYLGRFATAREASKAYQEASIKHYKEFANV